MKLQHIYKGKNSLHFLHAPPKFFLLFHLWGQKLPTIRLWLLFRPVPHTRSDPSLPVTQEKYPPENQGMGEENEAVEGGGPEENKGKMQRELGGWGKSIRKRKFTEAEK